MIRKQNKLRDLMRNVILYEFNLIFAVFMEFWLIKAKIFVKIDFLIWNSNRPRMIF